MTIDANYYVHESDKSALKALKAIPGFHQLAKAMMKVFSEREYRILNMSSSIRAGETQLKKYYDMLPPICEKLGIDVPELYLQLDVNPNAYTYGDTKPFIVITSGLLETIPEDLLPTVLAHECGHIACHHVLYRTIGSLLLRYSESALNLLTPLGLGNVASLPLEIAFFQWMRCSEYSADRAAIICDGNSDKMTEVCMRLAGFDKDIPVDADKEAFIQQAKDYEEMVSSNKWDKTLEFVILMQEDHPLMAVRALECERWENSDKFKSILDGSYITSDEYKKITKQNRQNKPQKEEKADLEEKHDENKKFGFKVELPNKPILPKIENPFSKHLDKQEDNTITEDVTEVDIPALIREYKQLFDEGVITKDEFEAKKKQLLNK